MYDLILTALYQLNNVNTDAEKARYLQSLQPATLELFRAYQSSFVNVDYREPNTQAAYMIRYFPQYSQIIRIILSDLKDRNILLPFNQSDLSVSFFGSGPSPEIYGFLQFLNADFQRVRKVTAYTFDIISDEWSYSREITVKHLLPSIWNNRQFDLVPNGFDLSQANSVDRFTDIIGLSKLIVFQNCLNEVGQNLYSNVIANLVSLVHAMNSNSILIIADLSNYRHVFDLTQRIEALIRTSNPASILISLAEGQKTYDARAMINGMPSIIRQNLLTGIPYQVENGLIPRRKIKYHCLTVRKD
jgi:hypothetical protein